MEGYGEWVIVIVEVNAISYSMLIVAPLLGKNTNGTEQCAIILCSSEFSTVEKGSEKHDKKRAAQPL